MNTTLKKMSGLAPEDLEGTVEFLDEQARLKPYYWLFHAEEALLSVARATDPRMRDALKTRGNPYDANMFSGELETVAKGDPLMLEWQITTAGEGGARAWAEDAEDELLEEFGSRDQDLVEAYRAERAQALQDELEADQTLVVGAALLAS